MKLTKEAVKGFFFYQMNHENSRPPLTLEDLQQALENQNCWLRKCNTHVLLKIQHNILYKNARCSGEVFVAFEKNDKNTWQPIHDGYCGECHQPIPFPLPPEQIQQLIKNKAKLTSLI